MEKIDLQNTFQKQGYVVIDSNIQESVLDGTINDLKKYFGEHRIDPIHTPHYGPGRIQDAWHISQNVLEIATSSAIIKTLKILYDKKAKPFQTLNFYKGTEQRTHSDSIHFNSEPFGAMCGVWTALEDIGMDQGPLVYYPGSQKLPEMNYQDFGLEADQSSYPKYLMNLQEIIKREGYQPEYGLLKKGQSLIWSANIFHGGSPQKDKSLTRHSQVTHYYLGNPKCWRPSLSSEKRCYFKPEKVRDVSGKQFKYPLKDPLIEPTLTFRVLQAIKRRLPLGLD